VPATHLEDVEANPDAYPPLLDLGTEDLWPDEFDDGPTKSSWKHATKMDRDPRIDAIIRTRQASRAGRQRGAIRHRQRALAAR